MNIGIEVECWVVDEMGRLCDGSDLTTVHDRIEPEFIDPLVEVKTEPHGDERGLREDLGDVFRVAIEAAAADGKRLVPLGTPLTSADEPAADDRGETMAAIYGDGIVSAKNCAGTHVHFDRRETRRQLNLLTALDPALALVSSSPYYRGTRRMDSSRAHAYRRECGDAFEQFCGIWEYAPDVAGWERRVDDAYDDFVELADDADVPADRVEARFRPKDTVLNPVRLRDDPATVEWRAPDATLPSQVLRLASDVAGLVAQTEWKPLERGPAGVHADRITIPPFETVESVSDEAIRWGLRSERVREYLAAFGFDTGAYRPIARQIDGPGRIHEREAREVRLAYADRLDGDVAALAETSRPTATAGSGQPYLHG